MIYSYITDPGRIRERNEDSVSIVKNAAGEILMVVADGISLLVACQTIQLHA